MSNGRNRWKVAVARIILAFAATTGWAEIVATNHAVPYPQLVSPAGTSDNLR